MTRTSGHLARVAPTRSTPARFPPALAFGLGCGLTLLFACYASVLFKNEQFAFRDAGDFYYPLYQYVQQEWDAGRWPLWDPGQSGGVPLVGNPTAAVFYPGKLVFFVLPYAWAARLYVVGHTVLAFAGMMGLMRSWGTSWVGASLAALSFAFGAPTLFQSCNVIYLVGAAWVPWGIWTLDRWLRRGRKSGPVELALVLALQTLGGDPEASYLVGLFGVGYAYLLVREEGRDPQPQSDRAPRRNRGSFQRRPWLGVLIALGVAVLLAARGAGYDLVSRWGAPAFWGVGCLGTGLILSRRGNLGRLGGKLAGLVVGAALAFGLAAVQVLPTLELSARSVRSLDESPLDRNLFSLHPCRLAELVWPAVFGLEPIEARSWLQAVPPLHEHDVWVYSIYVGGLTLALVWSGFRIRDVPAWQSCLSGVLILSLAASLGRFGGLLWWLRWVPSLATTLGPHDVPGVVRTDGFPGDGFGSPYGLMTALLPGFTIFRYPSKLLTFSAFAFSGLAGLGWDRLAAAPSRRMTRWCSTGLATSLAALAVLWLVEQEIAAMLARRLSVAGPYGPANIAGALGETKRALIQGGVVLALGLVLLALIRRHPRAASGLAMVVMTVDLGTANARLVWTVPQGRLETTSQAAALIAAAERARPSPGPFRVHRLWQWSPRSFEASRSPRRLRELVAWSRDTLENQNALPLRLCETLQKGGLESLDYLMFFDEQEVVVGGTLARTLGVNDGTRVLYAPRRGFDLWNTAYFILPVNPEGWSSPDRGFASLLPETARIFRDQGRDWQLVRNLKAFPRAWLVHTVRAVEPARGKPTAGDGEDDRLPLMRELLYQADDFWRTSARSVVDLRAVAFVETEAPAPFMALRGESTVGPDEAVTITRYESGRVDLIAKMNRPGLVILADSYYPGWHLTIDGTDAPIYRTNRMMRGALVPEGTHHLVYRYDPSSFRWGLALSGASLVTLVLLGAWMGRGVVQSRGLPAVV